MSTQSFSPSIFSDPVSQQEPAGARSVDLPAPYQAGEAEPAKPIAQREYANGHQLHAVRQQAKNQLPGGVGVYLFGERASILASPSSQSGWDVRDALHSAREDGIDVHFNVKSQRFELPRDSGIEVSRYLRQVGSLATNQVAKMLENWVCSTSKR